MLVICSEILLYNLQVHNKPYLWVRYCGTVCTVSIYCGDALWNRNANLRIIILDLRRGTVAFSFVIRNGHLVQERIYCRIDVHVGIVPSWRPFPGTYDIYVRRRLFFTDVRRWKRRSCLETYVYYSSIDVWLRCHFSFFFLFLFNLEVNVFVRCSEC